MLQQVVGDGLGLTQGGKGMLQVTRVSENDRGAEEVETGDAVLLVLVDALTDFAQHWMKIAPRQRRSARGRPVRQGRSVTFQVAEVTVPRGLFGKVLSVIAALRPLPPAPC